MVLSRLRIISPTLIEHNVLTDLTFIGIIIRVKHIYIFWDKAKFKGPSYYFKKNYKDSHEIKKTKKFDVNKQPLIFVF